ncbi:insulinase family protein [Bacteroidales bacterium OttesenSCG-928-C03]|nr:insulinase family protein [Bacteroidales bacterium OttesenSCG-928-C03]
MRRIKLLFTTLFCLAGIVLMAQTPNLNEKLPLSSKVRTGKLDNGLTYYVQANQKPENRAVFYLAVNAGSVLETEDQVGLAHFAEHMGFNGTKQFPGNTMIDQLEKKGIVFGREINAYTSFDETVYYLTLPTDDEELFNMGLKILDGWAFGMLMTGEEIDKERGVIIEEWRVRGGAQDRLRDKTLPIVLKGSQYAKRMPIGTLENLQQFKHNSIRTFYKTWYRPDNMAVVVVGDFDAEKMEQMIIDYFQMNDKPATPLHRTEYDIPSNKEPLIAIATDPEATSTGFSLNFKQPNTTTVTIGDYRRDLIYDIFTTMFDARISEIGENKKAPFQYGYSYYSDYWSRNNDAFVIYLGAKENKGLQSFEVALTEIKRLQQHGFVAGELKRAKEDMLSYLERAANEESKRESTQIASSLGYNFLENEPVPGAQYEYDLAKSLMDGITLDEVNKVINQWIKDENITVSFTMPEKKELKVPTEKDFLTLFDKAKKMKTTPYEDKTIDQPFLAKEPKTGKVTKRVDNKEFDYTELTLSNGAVVVIKSTDFKNDQIMLNAFSDGGTSLYPDNRLLNAQFAATVIGDCGIGNYTPIELNKFMAGKNFYVRPWISTLQEGLSGNTTVKDLETFMQYIYMVFEAPRKDKESFEKNIDSWRTSIKTQKNSPDYQFSVFNSKLRYPNDKRNIVGLEEKHLNQMNLDEMYKIFNERFSDGSDFKFFFVGNIDIDEFIPMVEKYIGGITSTNKKEKWMDRSQEFAKGIVDQTLYAGIGEQTRLAIASVKPFDWNDKDRLAVTMLNNIIRIKLTEDIRERLGGTYGTSFSLSPRRYPVPQITMSISLGCDPTRMDELTDAIFALLDDVIQNGPSEIDIDKAKKQLCNGREVAVKENNSWISWLDLLYDYGDKLQTLEEYQANVNAITVDDLKRVAKYVKHDEYVRAILLPESEKK